METEAAGLHDVHRANQLSLLATKLETIKHDIEAKLKSEWNIFLHLDNLLNEIRLQ